MKKMDLRKEMKDGQLPVFLKLRELLAERIESGIIAVGGRLPSERELAQETGAARMTVRKAFGMLEAEGLIYRADRRGYFVSAPRLRYDPTHHVNTMRQIPAQGHVGENLYLGRTRVEAGDSLALLFSCQTGTPLILERSVALMNGRKILYEENFLMESALPGYHDLPYESPLTQTLERRHGIYAEMTGFRARATNLMATAAEHLNVSVNSPGLHITRIKSFEDKTIEVDREYWLSDALEIVVGTLPESPNAI